MGRLRRRLLADLNLFLIFLVVILAVILMGAFRARVQGFLDYRIYSTALDGDVTVYVLLFSVFIIVTVWVSWYYGGHRAFVIVTIVGNLEILLFNFSTGNWEHIIEHANLVLAVALYFIESPADRRERKAHDVQERNRELEQRNRELKRFELIYQHELGLIESAAIDQKQVLQDLEFSWRNIFQEIIKSERHDLKNAFAEMGMDKAQQMIYDQFVRPFRDKILAQFEKLDERLDTRMSKFPVGDVCERVIAHFPPRMTRSRSYDLIFRMPENECDRARYVRVNVDRLYSVVFNVVTNSVKAISRVRDRAREEGGAFKGRIEVDFAVEDGEEFQITITDNAGGFPEEILEHVYVDPVVSSDRSRGERLGEGAMYVAFFVLHMDGMIEAENVTDADGKTGARTRIRLSIVEGDA